MQAIRKYWWIWIFALVVVLYILLSIFPFMLVKMVPSLGEIKPNELGDSFGLANSFFASLAFAGVIATLVLQMQELKAQRQEMVEMQRVQMLAIYLEYQREENSESEDNPNITSTRAYPDLLRMFLGEHVKQYFTQNNPFNFRKLTYLLWHQIKEHEFMMRDDTPRESWKLSDIFMGVASFASPFGTAGSLNKQERQFFKTIYVISTNCSLVYSKNVELKARVRILNTITSELEELMLVNKDVDSSLIILKKLEKESQEWMLLPSEED